MKQPKAVYAARMQAMMARDAEIFGGSMSRQRDFDARHSVKANGCWLWRGHISRTGYGVFAYKAGCKVTAHRYALLVTAGLPPDGAVYYACHKCRNKNCVNPDHLYWGTPKQNVRDAWDDPNRRTEEYRLRAKYAEKLSNEHVRNIWHKYWQNGESLGDLAEEFGVNSRYLSELIKGRYRKHVTRHLPKPKTRLTPTSAHRAEKNGNALFTNEQVQAMRRVLCGVCIETNLAKLLGVTTGVVSHIATGYNWKDLPWPDGTQPRDPAKSNVYGPKAPVRNVKAKRSRHDLTVTEIRAIFKEYWDRNEGQREIAGRYGTDNCTVSFIVNRKFGAKHTTDLKTNPDRKRRVCATRSPFTGHAKITPHQLAEVRRYIAAGVTNSEISAKYDRISSNMVQGIRSGKTFAKVKTPK